MSPRVKRYGLCQSQKCISVVFPDNADTTECEYYIANGRGMSIHSDDFIYVDTADGQEECIPWTLQTYIKLSIIRCAFKACFYCVKKFTNWYSAARHVLPIFQFPVSASSYAQT